LGLRGWFDWDHGNDWGQRRSKGEHQIFPQTPEGRLGRSGSGKRLGGGGGFGGELNPGWGEVAEGKDEKQVKGTRGGEDT